MRKISLSPWQLSTLAAVFIVVANNGALFAAIGEALGFPSMRGFGFLFVIALLTIVVINSLFLAFGTGRLQKPLIAVFLIATATFAYFANNMGIVFDEDMLMNMSDTITDRNVAEASELASPGLIFHVLVFGIIPALALYLVELRPRRFFGELASRLLVTGVSVSLLLISIIPNYQFISFFAVEHRDLRFQVMPVFPIMSLVRLSRDKLHSDPPFRSIDEDARQLGHSERRVVGIMVVGETARADHFSLAGYEKNTNPRLQNLDGLLFSTATSCGTSTRFSVPCMFSMKGHDNYSPEQAQAESNVLDILTAAGVQTIWIDNNSSCKHVCDRIENENLRRELDPSSPYFSDMGYMDEILTDKIDALLNTDGPDTLIVLHTLGSHGPAYSRRYPERFGVFSPYCDKASPTECSPGDVANAYDNTIVYTDYILSQLVEKLQSHRGDIDTFLVYASDHGESLGENGIYLHGLPYSIAPKSQTEVPIMVWFSAQFRASHGIDSVSASQFGRRPVSHDNLSHTLLGLYDVEATSYDVDLDLFAGTRLASDATRGPAPTISGGM